MSNNYNLYQLSFLGDAVFELLVREYLLKKRVLKLNDLQDKTLLFVTAKRQAYFVKNLTENNQFTVKEKDLIRRGRNIKTHKSPKNCDVVTYKYATAFEILIGYLYLYDKTRLDEIFDLIIKIVEGSNENDNIWKE